MEIDSLYSYTVGWMGHIQDAAELLSVYHLTRFNRTNTRKDSYSCTDGSSRPKTKKLLQLALAGRQRPATAEIAT